MEKNEVVETYWYPAMEHILYRVEKQEVHLKFNYKILGGIIPYQFPTEIFLMFSFLLFYTFARAIFVNLIVCP